MLIAADDDDDEVDESVSACFRSNRQNKQWGPLSQPKIEPNNDFICEIWIERKMSRRNRLFGCQITIKWFLWNKSIGTATTATTTTNDANTINGNRFDSQFFPWRGFLVAGFFWLLLIWKMEFQFNKSCFTHRLGSIRFVSFHYCRSMNHFFLHIHQKTFSSVHLVGLSPHHKAYFIFLVLHYIRSSFMMMMMFGRSLLFIRY